MFIFTAVTTRRESDIALSLKVIRELSYGLRTTESPASTDIEDKYARLNQIACRDLEGKLALTIN